MHVLARDHEVHIGIALHVHRIRGLRQRKQTKLKIESKSDKVYRVNQLITIDGHFDAPQCVAVCPVDGCIKKV